MKKLLLLLLCAFSLSLSAQTIDVLLDGGAFSMSSPNGMYIAGIMEDVSFYYNTTTKKISLLEGEIQDDGGCFIWDLNDKGQLAVDHMKKAAIWSETTQFEYLAYPNDIDENEPSAARCISNDGKYVVVSFGSPTTCIYLYTKGDNGVYTHEKMVLPEVAPIYNQIAQFIWPCGITLDGNRILGRFVTQTAEFELPFVWERTPAGDWSIRWLALDFIVPGGETDAEFYGETFEYEGEDDFEAAQNEWLQKRDEYYAVIDAVSTGYFYAGEKGDLSDLEMSENGKYAKMEISYKDLKSDDEEPTIYHYPAVIDLKTEQVYVFTCLEGAGCLSVTNDGVVSLATPKVEYFRYGHISSIADPTKSQTLTEYTKQKTGNKIDLAQHMTYENKNEESSVAEGGAVLFDNGSGFFTTQYKDTEEATTWETFIVMFGDGTATEIVNDNAFAVYPNPTNGILNFAETLENVEVFDLLGRKVYSISVAENSINLNNLVSGTYFLVADKNGERVSVKFVVK